MNLHSQSVLNGQKIASSQDIFCLIIAEGPPCPEILFGSLGYLCCNGAEGCRALFLCQGMGKHTFDTGSTGCTSASTTQNAWRPHERDVGSCGK